MTPVEHNHPNKYNTPLKTYEVMTILARVSEAWINLSRGWKATLIGILIVLFVQFGGEIPW